METATLLTVPAPMGGIEAALVSHGLVLKAQVAELHSTASDEAGAVPVLWVALGEPS